MLKTLRFALLFALLPSFYAQAQLAQNAPKDKPVEAIGEEKTKKFQLAITPYINKARETWPAAKQRFQNGLSSGQNFFVSVQLKEGNKFEIVFVKVNQINDGKIIGKIASQIELIKNMKAGDSYSCDEQSIIDWTISKPDGSEEGNFVGKFLDTYSG